MSRSSRNRGTCSILAILLSLSIPSSARAHFGVVLPSDDIVSQSDSRRLGLQVMFIHPFEGHFMNMDKPARFGVLVQGKEQDLLDTLQEKKVGDFSTWTAAYRIRRPGDHVFYVEPSPYFEPAEESFIIHYTKVIVNVLGLEEGWDVELGLKTEIVPLTRPYGLWAGNVFQGQVEAPANPFITQVVKADPNGVFTYAMPRAGWWGFAALSTDDRKLRHTDGEEYEIEIGAVLWIKTYDMK